MWKVFYHNRHGEIETFQGDVSDAPYEGVLLILESCPNHGRRVVVGGDYYTYDFGQERWLPRDARGLEDYLRKSGTQYKVMRGEMVFQEEWERVMIMAEADTTFPPRTAYYSGEPRLVND